LQVHAGQCIEGAEGLVEQEYFRFVDQRPCDGRTLCHATGQLVRVGVFEALQIDQLDMLGHQSRLFFFRQGMVFQRDGDILFHGFPREQSVVLEHDAALQASGIDTFAVEQNIAAVLGFQTDNQP